MRSRCPTRCALCIGNLSEGAIVDDALDGVDRVVHLGALVGVGQSMYEIERYVRDNTIRHRVFLERLSRVSRGPSRLVVASSMSIYGEGEYECRVHGRGGAPSAARGAALGAELGVRLPGVRSRAHARRDERDRNR